MWVSLLQERSDEMSLLLDMCVSPGAGCTAGSAGQSVELADLFVEGKTMDKIE
jgi:hypothetical protein